MLTAVPYDSDVVDFTIGDRTRCIPASEYRINRERRKLFPRVYREIKTSGSDNLFVIFDQYLQCFGGNFVIFLYSNDFLGFSSRFQT